MFKYLVDFEDEINYLTYLDEDIKNINKTDSIAMYEIKKYLINQYVKNYNNVLKGGIRIEFNEN